MTIFNKAIIDKLMVIRKRLKGEFGKAPVLTAPNLLEDILTYSSESKDAITKSQVRKLMEEVGEPWASEHAKSSGLFEHEA